MRNACNPRWLLFINTIPLVFLFLYLYDKYQVINSLLNEEQIQLWQNFALALALIGMLNLSYTVYSIVKKRSVDAVYAVVALLTYVTYLYFYGYYFEDFIPFSVPRWMLSPDIQLYVGTVLMPTLIHALFVLVVLASTNKNIKGIWKDFTVIVLVPAAWYLFAQVILPLWKPVSYQYSTHASIIITIIATVVFLFFIVRGIYVIGMNKSERLAKFQLLWKIPITILFPLLGLAINNGDLMDTFRPGPGAGVFGDFSHYWFYVIALVNGVLICLPSIDNPMYRLLLFAGRCITFSYTVYFFIVFLPYLPLSIIAIVAAGAGFLMLSPLLLFVIHTNTLVNDIRYLRNVYKASRMYATLTAGVVVIPCALTFSYLHDRAVLNEALDYVYNPDYSKQYDLDPISLKNTLNNIALNKSNNLSLNFNHNKPYLTAYFNWLVLDNLTLSRDKMNTLNKLFYAIKPPATWSRNEPTGNVEISRINSTSRFDEQQQAWISQIDLELTNKSYSTGLAEYATSFDLPTGAWISDYYLYVGERKEKGLLAEKRSAMWIYSQIFNQNRDPGLLYYLTGNKVAFRVFPFNDNEIRKTGIELIHKQPFEFKIDNQSLKLGEMNSNNKVNDSIENESVAFVSSQQKTTLDKISRKPYFHFIVDVSASQEMHFDMHMQNIESFLRRQGAQTAQHKISLTNTYVRTQTINDDWRKNITAPKFYGGFYLERAIKTVLFDAYTHLSERYPVIIVLSTDLNNAIVEKDFADFSFAYPDADVFYSLYGQTQLFLHSLNSNPLSKMEIDGIKPGHAVLAYPNKNNPIAYLADNNEPALVLKTSLLDTPEQNISAKNWHSGLMMQAAWRSHLLHPHVAKTRWRALVRDSFKTGLMTPLTSYIVVENEAQKQALLRKQQQVLSGNNALDPGEETRRMSEPGLLLMMLLLLFAWLVRKRFKSNDRLA